MVKHNLLLASSHWTVLLRKVFGVRLDVLIYSFAVAHLELVQDIGFNLLVLNVLLTGAMLVAISVQHLILWLLGNLLTWYLYIVQWKTAFATSCSFRCYLFNVGNTSLVSKRLLSRLLDLLVVLLLTLVGVAPELS